MDSFICEVDNLSDTKQLGQMLAQHLAEGSVTALIGTLGSGKTFLVQAIAEALGVEPGLASSPTFVLLHEYDGDKPIYHFDAYRLENENEFRQLGSDDYFEGNGLTFVEWADKFPMVLPSEYLKIQIEILEDTRRRFVLTAVGQRYEDLLLQLRQFRDTRVGGEKHRDFGSR